MSGQLSWDWPLASRFANPVKFPAFMLRAKGTLCTTHAVHAKAHQSSGAGNALKIVCVSVKERVCVCVLFQNGTK